MPQQRDRVGLGPPYSFQQDDLAMTEPLEQASIVLKGTRASDRYLAALFDNVFAILLAGVTVTSLEDSRNIAVPGIAAVLVFWLYFLVSEGLLSATPGKMIWGLRVVTDRGQRCGIARATVRTLTRLLKVNPMLLGGIPAAILITFTRRRKRLGDFLAATVVVHVSTLQDSRPGDISAET
jgi:uncharacterized RDD family membrane protein YckC